MRGMGGIGLVLINPGCDQIRARITRGSSESHEIGRTALHVQRVIRLKRDVHRSLATLGKQVKSVVEELTKDRHPAAVAR